MRAGCSRSEGLAADPPEADSGQDDGEAEEDRRLVPLEGPEAARGLVGDQVPEVELPSAAWQAWVGSPPWQALMVAALKARPELSRVWWTGPSCLAGRTRAVGVTISLLLRPAARLGEMLAGGERPRAYRAHISVLHGWLVVGPSL